MPDRLGARISDLGILPGRGFVFSFFEVFQDYYDYDDDEEDRRQNVGQGDKELLKKRLRSYSLGGAGYLFKEAVLVRINNGSIGRTDVIFQFSLMGACGDIFRGDPGALLVENIDPVSSARLSPGRSRPGYRRAGTAACARFDV